jgi:hypothetical protein
MQTSSRNVFGFDKENFESYLDESGLTVISEEDWEEVADEIEGRIDNFLEEVLPLIANDYLERNCIE